MELHCFASLRHTPSKISSPQGQEHSMSLERTWYNHTLSVLPPALRLRQTTTEQSRLTEAAKGPLLRLSRPTWDPRPKSAATATKHSPSQIYLCRSCLACGPSLHILQLQQQLRCALAFKHELHATTQTNQSQFQVCLFCILSLSLSLSSALNPCTM